MTLGLVVIEVCEQNAAASVPLEELEAEFFEIAVLRTNCLSMCHLCRAAPYAMVDKKRVFAKRPDQLFSLVEAAAVAQIKAFWAQ